MFLSKSLPSLQSTSSRRRDCVLTGSLEPETLPNLREVALVVQDQKDQKKQHQRQRQQRVCQLSSLSGRQSP